MTASADVDPRSLGKILLIQTTVHALPTIDAVADFVRHGLEELPGATGVAVEIRGAVRSESESARRGAHDRAVGGVLNVSIGTLHHQYGSIAINCNDVDALVPYSPFLGSLANTIALTLENRHHAASLERLNIDLLHAKEGLEATVCERTADLRSANEALGREIDEGRRAAERLRESESRYRDLFENASDAIFLLDLELNYVDVNRKACEVFGFTREELLQKNFRDLRPLEGDSQSAAADQEQSARGAVLFSLRQRTNEGRLLEVEISPSPVIDKGVVTGYRHIVRDVTAHRGLERALRQSQKLEAIGTLSSGIAHDFNNILTAIICSCDLAQHEVPPESLVQRELQRIASAGSRASDLVRQILAFSRPANDERKPLLLQPIVKESLKFLRASMPTTIEIIHDLSADSPMILGDATQIHQVIMNLCTNAYQAMIDTGGTLRVSLRRASREEAAHAGELDPAPRDYVLLEVADTGRGIDPSLLERIFDPYFTTRQKEHGTGLGLSVVHGIVKSHRGHIHVTSQAGAGSLFQVFLPSVADVRGRAGAPATRALQPGSERIWIADDEPSLVAVEQNMLENLGYQVRSFGNGSDLLDAFRATPDACDLVISDIGMSKTDGAQLARELLSIRPELPIILCTGFSGAISRDDALAIGVRDYIMKPLDFERISTAVRTTLDQAVRQDVRV